MHVMSLGQSGPSNRATVNVLDLDDTLYFVVGLVCAPENIAAKRERYQEHYPADKVLCEERCGNSVHAEGYSGTGRLDTLVVTGHTGKFEGVIADTGHGIVGKTLESGVTDVICELSVKNTYQQKGIFKRTAHEQDDRSGSSSIAPVPDSVLGVASKLELENQSANPDNDVENNHC